MEDVNISKFRAQVVRAGSTPASPGFVVSEGQNPVDPSGSGQNHLPVTIATASTGLSITESQVLGGAGTVGQYIRGDGSLADFPATTGGGSSVSYYLNGSVSQGTIGGVAYKELNKTPIFGAGTDISINADGYIASFITDAGDPNKLLIPAGNWNLETYFSASSSGGTPSFYVELYKYNGSTFTLIASSSSAPELIAFGTNLNPYFSTLAVPETILTLTDRLALRYYVTHSGRTITLHTENNHLCQVITTFTTGLTALNGLTSQVQYLTVGTSGTDFAISSASDTHTFNLPTASATNRGALSSADWTTFNNKTSNLGTVTSVGLSSATSGVTIGSTPVTTSGTITLAIATASGSQNGLLSSTDWTTFNSKQNALTNPVTGTGTTNYLPKFTGSTTIGNSIVSESSGIITVAGRFNANGNDYHTLSVDEGSAQLRLERKITSTGLMYLGADNVGFKIFDSGFTPRLILTSGGNLLVGTNTDAGFKLDVNGTGRFSGSVTAGNIIARRDSTTSATDAQFISENRTGSSGQYAIYGSRLDNGSGAGFVPVAFGAIQTSGAGRTGDFIIAVSNTDNVNLSTHERMRITSDGYARLSASSGGIQFNGDTAAANALDDYEEGTFTPSMTFGGGSSGISYFDRIGNYTKIGSQVTCTIYLALTGVGSSTGTAKITGLPFTASNANRGIAAASTIRFNSIVFVGQLGVQGQTNGTVIDFFQTTEAGVSSALTNLNFNSSSEMVITITYFTA
jgi:hypothetical protein